MSNDIVLKVEKLMMHFGGIKALSDVSLQVKRNSIFALIGPNGAGKTTVFNCLTGFYKATGGKIELNVRGSRTNVIKLLGESFQVTDFVSPKNFASRLFYKMFGGTHLVNRAGLARTFQNIRLFKEMSVVENLLVAQHMWVNRNMLAGILNTKGYRKAESDALDHAFYWLEVVDLVDCANRLAGELSYGQQRRLEIARAMCTRPQIICLDEPAAGLNPQETEALSAMIRLLRDEHDLTVVLIVLVAQQPDHRAQRFGFLRVEAGGRFVEADDLRPRAHGPGDFQTTLLPVGKFASQTVGAVHQVHHFQPVEGVVQRIAFGLAGLRPRRATR